jgi:hypothetical protein
MSEPRFELRDPPPLRDDDVRSRRLNELESSNAMWGWVAGAVVLALVLIFVFTRGQVSDTNTASNVPSPPAATTGMAPPSNPAPLKTPAPAPAPPASTAGQGSH